MTGLRILAALALACVTLIVTTGAEARQRHKTYLAHPDCNITMPCQGVAPSPRGEYIAGKLGFGGAQKVYTPRAARSLPEPRQRVAAVPAQVIGGRPAGCPHAFCGCGASLHLFGKIIPALNLAANWLRFPRAAPAPKMAAARRGHVFVLERHIAGDVWLVHDSNSGGHRTRLHARSIAGYVVVNPHGAG